MYKQLKPEVKWYEQKVPDTINTFADVRDITAIVNASSTNALVFLSTPYGLTKGTDQENRVGVKIHNVRLLFTCIIKRNDTTSNAIEFVKNIISLS